MAKRFLVWIVKASLFWGAIIGVLVLAYQFGLYPYLKNLQDRDAFPTVRGYRIPYPPESKWYTAHAIFEAEEPAVIKASQQGKIKTILVHPGDSIEAGKPILKLDTAAYLERLQELKGLLQDESLAETPEIPAVPDKVEQTSEPITKPMQPKTKAPQKPMVLKKLPPVNFTKKYTETTPQSSRIEITETTTTEETVASNLNTEIEKPLSPTQQLQKEIGFLQWLIDDATIQAPVSGTISKVLIKAGDALLKDMPILELESQNTPTFRLSLDPQIGAQLHVGQKMIVNFTDSHTIHHRLGATFQGFDESSDTTHANITVVVQASDLSAIKALNTGDEVSIQFQIINPDDIEIPCRTTYSQSGTYWVVQMLRRDAHYQLSPKPVLVEVKSDTRCQVLSGLLPGDLIVYPEINHPLPKQNALVNVTYDALSKTK